MTALVSIMEAISPPYTWLKPNLGLNSCWFDGQYAEVIYFYGPIGMFVGIGEGGEVGAGASRCMHDGANYKIKPFGNSILTEDVLSCCKIFQTYKKQFPQFLH